MISIRLSTWLHLGRQTARVIVGDVLGSEIPGPIDTLADTCGIPLTGPPSPCEDCETIYPYADLWRSMAIPSRAFCEACLPTAVRR